VGIDGQLARPDDGIADLSGADLIARVRQHHTIGAQVPVAWVRGTKRMRGVLAVP